MFVGVPFLYIMLCSCAYVHVCINCACVEVPLVMYMYIPNERGARDYLFGGRGTDSDALGVGGGGAV